MKKTLLALLSLAGAASMARADVLVNEPFAYSDGDLTAVSGGVWGAHSGAGAQPVKVTGERASFGVSGGSAEDVNISLGVTNTTEDVYASFVFNFSSLPTATEYFVHFKDEGTGFRCRVFSTTSGAGEGQFRVGVRNGSSGTITYIPTDLALNTDYKLVVRLRGSTDSTIWINPTSESSGVNRADGVDVASNPFNGSSAFALRQASGMGTLTLDDLLVGTQFSDVQTVGGPPTISGVDDQHVSANSSTGPVSVMVVDVETAPESLVLAGVSDNPSLVTNDPASNGFAGSGTNRTVTVTPAAGQQGTATIQLTVTDGNNESSSSSFKIYVGEPTISAVANQTTATNTVLGPLAITVTDAETPGSLTVTPSSSNPGLIPDANIVVTGSGSSRSVTITPATDTAGLANITLTVSDGTFSVPSSFVVTVYPKLGLLITEPFEYADGSLVGNGGWVNHSGTNGDAQVIGGQLALTYARSEDISLGMPNPYFYFATNSGVILYKSFKVNFSALPGTGEYFAHYRDTTTFNYRARLFAGTSSAAPGNFRLAIANAGFTYAAVPRDLETNVTYLVITRYNTGTGESTVWVNPASEIAGGASATDLNTPIDIWHTSFRQNSGIGTMTVDDLKIGTQWGDVWEATAPGSEALTAQKIGNDLVLSWTNPAFALQTASEVSGIYTTIVGATSPYTNAISGGPVFFRLKY